MYKVLLIEDDREMGDIVRAILGSNVSVDHVYLRKDFKKCLELGRYNLFLVDLNLTDCHGHEIFAMIQSDSKHANAPIVFLTGEGSDQSRLTGLGIGADDYVVKPIRATHLRTRILGLLESARTGSLAARRIYGHLLIDMLALRVWVKENDNSWCPVDLTPLEFRILCVLIEHRNNKLDRSSLLHEVWGDNVPVTNRMLDQTVFSLRRKLGVRGQCIQTVFGAGYKLLIPESEEIVDEFRDTYQADRKLNTGRTAHV